MHSLLFVSPTPDPRLVAAARAAAMRWLASQRVDPLCADDAILVVSELVTNAVRHARTSFTLAMSAIDDHGVRVEVFDLDRRHPTQAVVDPLATGGRGIPLVASVTTAWGSDLDERDGVPGKVVWAELRQSLGARPRRAATNAATSSREG